MRLHGRCHRLASRRIWEIIASHPRFECPGRDWHRLTVSSTTLTRTGIFRLQTTSVRAIAFAMLSMLTHTIGCYREVIPIGAADRVSDDATDALPIPPVVVPDVQARDGLVCALRRDGTFWCWGGGDYLPRVWSALSWSRARILRRVSPFVRRGVLVQVSGHLSSCSTRVSSHNHRDGGDWAFAGASRACRGLRE